MHYNWHRYFDPSIGRFITGDPLGQAGGVNVYNYALNNPISIIDFNGQGPVAVGVCAFVAGVSALKDAYDYAAIAEEAKAVLSRIEKLRAEAEACENAFDRLALEELISELENDVYQKTLAKLGQAAAAGLGVGFALSVCPQAIALPTP